MNQATPFIVFVFVVLSSACSAADPESGACEIEKTNPTRNQCIDNYLGAACDAVPGKKGYSASTCAALGYTVECNSLGNSPANGLPQTVYGRSESDCD